MTVNNLKKLLIEYKRDLNKNKDWIPIFALLDYIRDMELTYICKDALFDPLSGRMYHILHDDENNPMALDCTCIVVDKKKLLHRALYEIKQVMLSEFTEDKREYIIDWMNEYTSLIYII